MKKTILGLIFALLLSMTGCAGESGQEPARLTIVATTYPVYLFAAAVTDGVEGVAVERLNTGETSCLHDYTLSVSDMKKLEKTNLVALNGAGMEEFMEDALATSSAQVIDCAQGIALLPSLEDEDEVDGHIWMDPQNAARMVENLAAGLGEQDPSHAEEYERNAQSAIKQLESWDAQLRQTLAEAESMGGLITFHDGFQYFAKAYDLKLLAAIEEEAGSEASAREILDISQLVKEYALPVIFTEVNGSDATAKAIARETGCAVAQLSMCMDGPDDRLENYYDALMGNAAAIANGLSGAEGGRA